MRAHGAYFGEAVEQVDGLLAVRAVKEEIVGVQVDDIADKWQTS